MLTLPVLVLPPKAPHTEPLSIDKLPMPTGELTPKSPLDDIVAFQVGSLLLEWLFCKPLILLCEIPTLFYKDPLLESFVLILSVKLPPPEFILSIEEPTVILLAPVSC